MTQSNHTPLPWASRNGLVFSGEIQVADCGLYWLENDDYSIYEEADANYIVRACNSHYELLDALKNLLALYDNGEMVGVEQFDAAKAAIAKAEGEI